MSEEFFIKELDYMLNKTEDNLNELNKNLSELQQNDVIDELNIDWGDLAQKLKKYENVKNQISKLKTIKNKNEILKKLESDRNGPNEDIRLIKLLVNYFLI